MNKKKLFIFVLSTILFFALVVGSLIYLNAKDKIDNDFGQSEENTSFITELDVDVIESSLTQEGLFVHEVLDYTSLASFADEDGPNAILVSSNAFLNEELKSEFICSGKLFPIEVINYSDDYTSYILVSLSQDKIISEILNVSPNVSLENNYKAESFTSPCQNFGTNYQLRIVMHPNKAKDYKALINGDYDKQTKLYNFSI